MAERTDELRTGTQRPIGLTAAPVGEEDTTVIRAEIIETRERMGGTLDEIGERLNPHVIKDQVTKRVKDGVHEATIGRMEHMADSAREKVSRTGSTIGDTIRDNPVPAAMAALGLGWLLWNGRKEAADDADEHDARRRGYTSRGRTDAYGLYGDGNAGNAYAAGGSRYGRASYGATSARGMSASDEGDEGDEGMMDRARDRAGELEDRARDEASHLADRAHDAADSVSHHAHDLADSVSRRTRRHAGRVEDMFHDNPLAIGAVTMALGVAAGLAAPTTDREARLMGDARDHLVDRVKEIAHDAGDRAEHVADVASDAAKDALNETKDAAKSEAKGAARDSGMSAGTNA